MLESLKTIAMYLPQYHRVKENDEWWGEGYTEWTAVKKAEPLFAGEIQPVRPLNDNYYNLLNRETMEWQANLARKYEIDGFCFYHYWFGDSRLVLEKPAENLLKWKDIDIKFCFSWDAGSWARTWTCIGNSWADKFENKRTDSDGNGILIQQVFGGEPYWKKHFEYLLPFFKDPRYICVNGCPVFVFYSSVDMPCFEHMCRYWRKLAKSSGFHDLYIVALSQQNSAADAVVLPMSFRKQNLGYNLDIAKLIPGTSILGYDYDEVWQEYLNCPPLSSQTTLWQCMVDYDDTPRRGDKGRVYLGCTVQKFEKYFRYLYQKSKKQKNPLLFVDAWNEWAEGKYLEPDTRREHGLLEAIRRVKQEDGTIAEWNYASDRNSYVMRLEEQIARYQRGYFFLLKWIQMQDKTKSIQKFFEKNNIRTISIYGFGMHGHLFYQLMKNTDVEVKYAIDRQSKGMDGREDIPVFSLQDELPSCDAIVISLINDYVKIADELEGKTTASLISLYEVIAEAAVE